jgi:DNA primase
MEIQETALRFVKAIKKKKMTIEHIKSQLTIRMVLDHYNIKPDSSITTGKANSMINCPFHDDKTPSMQIYDKTNTAFCFSSNCSLHGKSIDVIDFVKHKEFNHLSKAEAKHEALKKCVSLIPSVQTPSPILSVSSVQSVAINTPTLSRIELLQKLFTLFKTSVISSPTAKNYLNSRNLDYSKIEVGYNAANFHHVGRFTKQGESQISQAEKEQQQQFINDCIHYGLLLDREALGRSGSKTYQIFGKYCICFPLKNNQNQIVSLYFRSSVPSVAEGEALEASAPKHFYLKDRQGLYPCYPYKSTTKLILTESIIDAATLLQIPEITSEYSIVACYGTNGLTDEHIQSIKELKQLQEIIFAFDNDGAGNKAVEKYAEQLNEQLEKTYSKPVELSKLHLPSKDINEVSQDHQDDSIFIQLLHERERLKTAEGAFAFSSDNNLNEVPVNNEVTSSTISTLSHLLINQLNTDNPNKLIYKTQTATYCIMGGLPKQLDNLKVMLQVENERGFKSRNKIDLYEDKQVEKISKDIAEKLLLNQSMLEQDLYTLTELLEQYREQSQNKDEEQEQSKQVLLSEIEKSVAIRFLQQDKTIKKLNQLLAKTGIVGEERNRIFLFLIALSYKMKDPLHALVQGSSGSGKTKIVRQISDCMPSEKVTRFTRISDKALYNFPQFYFKNRLLIIEDVDGLSEEAELSFRELQSSGELRSGMSIKQENGSITGGAKIVNGPIASMSCTTKGEVYEDNMSRVFLIAVDESLEQTKRIISYQNKIASGVIDVADQKRATTLVQNIIRCIEAKPVINPFAEKIHLPEEAHKIRRLNDLFQNFIKMVTLINQYKRQTTKFNQLIAEIEDIEIAIEIMFESIVLKVDELDGSLRQFYERLKAYLKKNYPKLDYSQIQFSQREIRQALNLSKAQINRYLQSLVDLEYMAAYGHSNKGFKYKVQYWDDYEAMRKRIKDFLSSQIETLKLKIAV